MNFLLDYGMSEELISKMIDRYDEGVIDLFKLESENVISVIEFFNEIGIKCIDQLLLFRIEVFTKDVDKVKREFNKHNVKMIVDDINEDIMNIDFI